MPSNVYISVINSSSNSIDIKHALLNFPKTTATPIERIFFSAVLISEKLHFYTSWILSPCYGFSLPSVCIDLWYQCSVVFSRLLHNFTAFSRHFYHFTILQFQCQFYDLLSYFHKAIVIQSVISMSIQSYHMITLSWMLSLLIWARQSVVAQCFCTAKATVKRRMSDLFLQQHKLYYNVKYEHGTSSFYHYFNQTIINVIMPEAS